MLPTDRQCDLHCNVVGNIALDDPPIIGILDRKILYMLQYLASDMWVYPSLVNNSPSPGMPVCCQQTTNVTYMALDEPPIIGIF